MIIHQFVRSNRDWNVNDLKEQQMIRYLNYGQNRMYYIGYKNRQVMNDDVYDYGLSKNQEEYEKNYYLKEGILIVFQGVKEIYSYF